MCIVIDIVIIQAFKFLIVDSKDYIILVTKLYRFGMNECSFITIIN